MAIFNLFSDPVLKARQDQLDGQWRSLNGAQSLSDCIPDTAWVEFVNDYKHWQEFYDSGSDWSDDSKHATDEWQTKAKEWERRFREAGCGGAGGSGVDSGLPSVKDSPEDPPGVLDSLKSGVGDVKDFFTTAGWVAVGLVVLVVVAVVYVLTRGKVQGYGVKVGGES